MIKNKLESLSGSKFASFKLSSLNGTKDNEPKIDGLMIGGSSAVWSFGPMPSGYYSHRLGGEVADWTGEVTVDNKYTIRRSWNA